MAHAYTSYVALICTSAIYVWYLCNMRVIGLYYKCGFIYSCACYVVFMCLRVAVFEAGLTLLVGAGVV